jgi:hypothetical protein
MNNYLKAILVGMAFAAAGCAIHPLPEDVTGVPTYVIAKKIRCEARTARRSRTIWSSI